MNNKDHLVGQLTGGGGGSKYAILRHGKWAIRWSWLVGLDHGIHNPSISIDIMEKHLEEISPLYSLVKAHAWSADPAVGQVWAELVMHKLNVVFFLQLIC